MRTELRTIAHLVDAAGKPWIPVGERAQNGCVIIIHGLHDGDELTAGGEVSHWMRTLAGAIETRTKGHVPNICLVDWHEGARPGWLHRLHANVNAAQFLMDLAAIRPEALEVGDLAGYHIARLIMRGDIRRDRPIHLIGHSAGGFAVARIALILHDLGIAPEPLHVSILDTPTMSAAGITKDEFIEKLPQAFPGTADRSAVDFYITSPFVMVGRDYSVPGIHIGRPKVPASCKSPLQKHSYAYDWFIETTEKEKARTGDGFDRSPLDKPPGK